MTGRRLLGAIMVLGLLASVPLAAVGQDDPSTPEGIDWALTSYLSDDSADLTVVPFGVAATLRLDDGSATGSGGCNAFSGNYRLRDEAILFSDELTRTLKLCEDAIQDVEDDYLSNLPMVATWSIDNGVLEFYDDFDDLILTFEVPNVVLTAGQLASLMTALTDLQASIDALDRRVDNANVPKLRDRLKALEAETQRLRQQIRSAPRATPRPTPRPTSRPTAGLSKAEQILLKAVPSRIAGRCSSWKQIVPPGTVAALRCTPNTSTTSSVIYHLLEGDAAHDAFDTEMSLRSVPPAEGADSCATGVRSRLTFSVGRGLWYAEGCDRDPGPSVFLAFVEPATNCKQLGVAGTRLRDPALYVTLQGDQGSIARTYDWAMRGSSGSGDLGITERIASNGNRADSC